MPKPELPVGYLGPQGSWQAWGMSTVNFTKPEIDTKDSELKISLKTSQPMKVTANLISCSKDQQFKENVFTQTEGDTVTLELALPEAGFFKLQIYALPASDSSKTLPNVYNYLIHSSASCPARVAPYPKQFAQWKEGCYLSHPLRLENAGDTVNFKVVIPGAKAVALTVDTEWFHLQRASKSGSSDDRGDDWVGEVTGLNAFRGKVSKASLNANYGPDDSKYTSLLEYNL